MKKFILIILVLMLSVSVFATGYVRSNLNVLSFSHVNLEQKEFSEKVSMNTFSTMSPLNFSAGYLFGISERNELGFDVSLGINYTNMEMKSGNMSESQDSSSVLFEINLADRFLISEKLSLLGTAGFHAEFGGQGDTDMNLYGLNINVGILYNIAPSFALSAGLDFDAIFGGTITASNGSSSQKVDIDMSGVSIAPYIGLGFLF